MQPHLYMFDMAAVFADRCRLYSRWCHEHEYTLAMVVHSDNALHKATTPQLVVVHSQTYAHTEPICLVHPDVKIKAGLTHAQTYHMQVHPCTVFRSERYQEYQKILFCRFRLIEVHAK